MKKIAARLAILGIILGLAVPIILSPQYAADAQGTNLLRNGDFSSGGFYGIGGKGQVPVGWSTWANGEAPVNDCHQDPTNEGRVRSGPCAWVQRGAFVPFTGGGYQQVSGLTEGSTYRFTIWAFVWTCDDRVNSCIGANGRTSDRASQARARIGVDPTGGTNANADSVVWSPFFTPWDAFRSQSIDIVATGGSMTVFTYYTSSVAMAFNEIYWDDASLVELGEGEGNPANTGDGEDSAPPPPQFVPFVQAQSARPDGSVVHVVGEGDTFASIAVAYRDLASREEILALNGWDLPPAIISIGQEIKILPPGSVDPDTGRLLNQGGTSAAPTNTPAATPPPPPPPPQDGQDGGDATTQPTPTSPPPPPSTDDGGGSGTGGSIGPRTPIIDPDVEKGGSLIPGGSSPSFFSQSYRTFKRPSPRRVAPQQDSRSEVGTVCVRFFDDQNSDARLGRNEPLIQGGIFTLDKEQYMLADTTGQLCVDVASGEQIIDAVAPSGYGFINGSHLQLTVYPQKTITVDFGVIEGVSVPYNPPAADENSGDDVETVTVIADTNPNDDNLVEQLVDNSAFIVFGFAGLVGLFSIVVVWSYRR